MSYDSFSLTLILQCILGGSLMPSGKGREREKWAKPKTNDLLTYRTNCKGSWVYKFFGLKFAFAFDFEK